MNFNINDLLEYILPSIIPLIFGIGLHEAAHAYAARWMGDDTAERLGRITLNPIRHIDPFGTLILPILLLIMSNGSFSFGYAKPVPVNYVRLRRINMRTAMQVVAFAGPAANLLMAFGWAIAFALFSSLTTDPFFTLMSQRGIELNLVLFAFNLFPILPLDGGRVLNGFLPRNLSELFQKLEPYGIWIVLFLVYATPNAFDNYWLKPIVYVFESLLRPVVNLIQSFFY